MTQQRVSKAASVFPPIVSQRELDSASAPQRWARITRIFSKPKGTHMDDRFANLRADMERDYRYRAFLGNVWLSIKLTAGVVFVVAMYYFHT